MHVGYTTDEFVRVGKQFKFGSYTNNTTEIYLRVCKIFDFLWNGEKIRQIGIRIYKPYAVYKYSNEFVLLHLKSKKKTKCLMKLSMTCETDMGTKQS